MIWAGKSIKTVFFVATTDKRCFPGLYGRSSHVRNAVAILIRVFSRWHIYLSFSCHKIFFLVAHILLSTLTVWQCLLRVNPLIPTVSSISNFKIIYTHILYAALRLNLLVSLVLYLSLLVYGLLTPGVHPR